MEKGATISKEIKAPVHSVVAANGEKLELVGQGEVSITIGGVTIEGIWCLLRSISRKSVY